MPFGDRNSDFRAQTNPLSDNGGARRLPDAADVERPTDERELAEGCR